MKWTKGKTGSQKTTTKKIEATKVIIKWFDAYSVPGWVGADGIIKYETNPCESQGTVFRVTNEYIELVASVNDISKEEPDYDGHIAIPWIMIKEIREIKIGSTIKKSQIHPLYHT